MWKGRVEKRDNTTVEYHMANSFLIQLQLEVLRRGDDTCVS